MPPLYVMSVNDIKSNRIKMKGYPQKRHDMIADFQTFPLINTIGADDIQANNIK